MDYISLFSGIEAASVAWEPLGWNAKAFAEIDPFPCAVLAARWPDVENLGDVTRVDWGKWNGKADIVIGGSPCQAFSFAGLRKGLADPRGSLMLVYLKACAEIDPEWVVWENVPGILPADERRAFQAFLEAVVGLWPRGGVCWRVLDSQFFGVAQRRRRVYAVVNTRDWRRAAAVLQEPEGMFGDRPSNREKRQEIARASGFSAPRHRGGEDAARASEHDVTKTFTMLTSFTGANGTNVSAEDISYTLDRTKSQCVAYKPDILSMADLCANTAIDEDLCGTLKVGGDASMVCLPEKGPFEKAQDIAQWVVRGLTPVECERLQGFPDNHTDLAGFDAEEIMARMPLPEDDRKRKQVVRNVRRWCVKCPDGPRYKACGNSMTVPVIEWIGERIEMVDEIATRIEAEKSAGGALRECREDLP